MNQRVAPSAALARAGIQLPAVARPLAVYTPAAWALGVPPLPGQVGRLRTSGQLPTVEGRLVATGRVCDDPEGDCGQGAAAHLVSPQQAYECARVAALNALAAAARVAGGVDQLVTALAVTVFVNSAPTFTGQAQVANGASELLGNVFAAPGCDPQGRPYQTQHTRSAVGVAVLPVCAPVEVEVEFLALGQRR